MTNIGTVRLTAIVLCLASACVAPDAGEGRGPLGDGVDAVGPAVVVGDVQQTIGVDDTIPGHDLHRVVGGFRTRSGHIVLADGSTNEIRVFDEEARLVRRFGGTGRGPEEFAALQAVWSGGGDTIIAYDLLAQRITFWTPGAGLGKEVRISFRGLPGLVARLADGTYVGYVLDEGGLRQPGLSRTDSGTVVRASALVDSAWVIARYPHTTVHTIANPLLDGRPTMFALPTAPSGFVSASRQHVYIGYGDGRAIRKYGLSDGDEDSIVHNVLPQEMSPAARSAWIDQRVGTAPRADRSRVRRFLEAVPYPERFPAIDAIKVDVLDNLWIRHFRPPQADSTVWSVYSPCGVASGEAVLAADLRVLDIGTDYLLALRGSETDVEVAVVLSLTRARG